MSFPVDTTGVPRLFTEHLDILGCPECRGPLTVKLGCPKCGKDHPVCDGIPMLFSPHEPTGGKSVTEIVQAFYEDSPFPNYDDLDTRESLRGKAGAGLFARLLDDQIPQGSLVLEAGCGTGQLSNF